MPLNNPFSYEPHPLALAAAEQLKAEIARHPEWHAELAEGKMLGVMVVATPRLESKVFENFQKFSRAFEDSSMSALFAFSGTLCGKSVVPPFVPPVFDLHTPGCHFQQEEAAISALNHRLAELEATVPDDSVVGSLQSQAATALAALKQRKREATTIPEKQFLSGELRRTKQRYDALIAEAEQQHAARLTPIRALKQERRQRSEALQQWLFRQFRFLNGRGEERSLLDLFAPRTPPSGAGECCAPKLLQYALRHHLRPLCWAEFWVGKSPRDEVRHEGTFYPACNTKCRPILTWMMQGLDVMPDTSEHRSPAPLRILYSDSQIAVVAKPAGMLSVPGKGAHDTDGRLPQAENRPSVKSEVQRLFPHAQGSLMVHRLDMDTSGLMVVALTEHAYHHLQMQFALHRVEKRYTATLERDIQPYPTPPRKGGSKTPTPNEPPFPASPSRGVITLPLAPNPADRPRQMVSREHGKPAVTRYEVCAPRTVHLWPETGRTHQLRVHMAHPEGLNNPILGDPLYGTHPAAHSTSSGHSSTLQLCADRLAFLHPVTQERIEFSL